MCQGVLHCEQKENWQEEHTTAWLRWLREIGNMPKNFLFVFLWETSSVKVHTVSQPGRGHHINLGLTATSKIIQLFVNIRWNLHWTFIKFTCVELQPQVKGEHVIGYQLPHLGCKRMHWKFNGQTALPNANTYFIACELAGPSLLVVILLIQRAVGIWTANGDISTSNATMSIHLHALKFE
jgi:hypothetical protein